MDVTLPRYVALKSLSNNKYLRFVNEDVSDHGFLQFSGEEFLSLYTKFELEMSQTKFGLYNIRCCYTNKYLAAESWVSPCLVPRANEPNKEDNWSSTLFEPIAVVADAPGGGDDDDDDDRPIIVQFRHFHSKEYATASLPEQTTEAETQEPIASLPDQSSPEKTTDPEQPVEPISFSPKNFSGGLKRVTVPLVLSGRLEGTTPPESQKFLVIDLESFFILPKLVAFKALASAGGQYLGARTIRDQPHLQLVSNEVADPTVVNEVLAFSDGSVSFTSKHSGKIWRSSAGGIVADYDLESRTEEGGREDKNETRFVPIKLGRNLVALKNAVTGKFCTSHTAEGKTKCLNDAVDDAASILKGSIFEVHEPVISREIYDVEFNILDARIYENKVVTLATHGCTNTRTEPITMNFKLDYTLDTLSIWNNNLSFMEMEIETTLKSTVPSVVSDGEIKITNDFEGRYEWGKEISVSSVEKERTIVFTVPPKTKVGVKVMATQAKCDVPFFYSRHDSLTNGEKVVYAMDDGIYTGISSYGIKYEFTESQL